MNKYFNIRRLGLLCKNEVFSNYKSWGIYLLTVIGIYTVIAMIVAGVDHLTLGNGKYDPNSLNYLFPGFLFIGGYITTSLTFSDINDKFKSSLWFSLPGSSLEKYLVGSLVSSFGYSIFIILSFVIASTVSILFTKPFFGTSMAVFNPISLVQNDSVINIMYMVLIYILTQSIFLVGSIVFKKAAFIKTVLAGSVIQSLISMILMFLSYLIVKAGVIKSWDIRIFISIGEYFSNLFLAINPEDILGFITKWTLVIGIPFSLFFHVVGYFKLTEKEVKGGI